MSSAVFGVEAILANGEQVVDWARVPGWRRITIVRRPKAAGEIGQLLEANRDIVQNPPWSNTARGWDIAWSKRSTVIRSILPSFKLEPKEPCYLDGSDFAH